MLSLPPPVHDPDEVREAADAILADPRYDVPPEPLPERILGWFAEQIGEVLGSVVGSGAGAVIAWAVVLAAIGFVVYLIVRYGRVGRIELPARPRASTMVELSRSPAEWRAEADALEAEGRWREGLRARHRGLVAELVGLGVIPDQAGRTAGEYAADVRRHLPAAAEPMAAATALFERAWYGGAATGPDEAQRFRYLEARVLAAPATRGGDREPAGTVPT
ncbi:MAG TPA: DUF4129 domain-containing protein [Acidimicrobiales bacterium]|nr:DUF4129 domain-containing protein [Acidimicrobiales bacterium]